MSAETNGHDTHEDGAVHAHISPAWFYIAVFMGLLFLTALTVGQSYVDLGRLNLFAVVLIASLKATLVGRDPKTSASRPAAPTCWCSSRKALTSGSASFQ